MRLTILLGVGLDLFGILVWIGGRGGLFGGLGDFESGHLLPMLFDECVGGLMSRPAI